MIYPCRCPVLKWGLIRRWLGPATTAAFACLLSAQAPAKEKPQLAAQVLEVGSFRLEWVPAQNWQSKVIRESACAIFQYTDEPARTIAATIGLFRLVVPLQARSSDRIKLAAAYATHDVAGAQKALFGSNAQLVLLSKTAKAINGGQLLSYAEPIDVRSDRSSSTEFVRAWIYFPRSYVENGALYLVLGREQSAYLEFRPTELEKAEEIIAGIRDS